MGKTLIFCLAGIVAGTAMGLGGCIPADPLVLVPSDLPNGVVGMAYTATLGVEGGGANRWSITQGELSAGLELDSRAGTIGGTPTRAGEFSFILQAADSRSFRSGEASYSITIIETLTVGATLPPGRVQEPYNPSISVTGGVPPYSFNIIGLPAGIGYDSTTGTFSGTPIYPVDGELLEVTVTDSGEPRQNASALIPLVIKNLPVCITTESLPDVIVGQRNYSHFLQVAEGVPPYSWMIDEGYLVPLGLELVVDTGEIRNRRDLVGRPIPIPANAEAQTFTVKVTDTESPPMTASRQFTIGIGESE